METKTEITIWGAKICLYKNCSYMWAFPFFDVTGGDGKINMVRLWTKIKCGVEGQMLEKKLGCRRSQNAPSPSHMKKME